MITVAAAGHSAQERDPYPVFGNELGPRRFAPEAVFHNGSDIRQVTLVDPFFDEYRIAGIDAYHN
jgi:hypothetical protein